MELTDEYLEYLGGVYCQDDINGKYDITFERFVELNRKGVWENFKKRHFYFMNKKPVK